MAVKALGKGLSALLLEDDDNSIDNFESKIGAFNVAMVPPLQLRPGPYQPRETFIQEKIDELAESIRVNGIIQPILVRATERDGIYQIIAGERRWRACKQLNLAEVPVIIRNVNDREALELALIENIQRQNLTPIEEADAYKKLQVEFSYTQEELSSGLGKSRSHIANMLRLLELPNDVKSFLHSGALTMGHARALTTAKAPSELAQLIISKGLSVREAEKFSAGYGKNPTNSPKRKKEKKPDIAELERILSLKIGLKINIEENKNGGKVSISYNSMAGLDKIVRLLG